MKKKESMKDIYKAEIKFNNDIPIIEKEKGIKPIYFDSLLSKLKESKEIKFIKTNVIKIQNDVISYLFNKRKLYIVISNKPIEINIKEEDKSEKNIKENNIKEKKLKRIKNKVNQTSKLIFQPIKQIYYFILQVICFLYTKIKSFYLQTFRSKLSRYNAKQMLLDKNFDINVIEKLLPDKKFITKKEIKINLADFLKSTNNSKNLLKNIKAHNENFDTPYVISLIGTNGVGKSTTISKLIHLLTVDNQFNVTIIAGDTFRSGAVEQLQGYVSNFINMSTIKNGKIRFFSRGYVKDEVSMINYAINTFNREFMHMKINGISNINEDQFSYSNFKRDTINNIVIIDTSGRQPTNDSLMNSLLKLHRSCLINQSYIVSEIITGQKNNILKFISILKQININLEVIFTKLDCTNSEIGMIFNTLYDSDISIAYVCYGEKNTDISVFNENYVLKILDLY